MCIWKCSYSVSDPFYFDTDPDPKHWRKGKACVTYMLELYANHSPDLMIKSVRADFSYIILALKYKCKMNNSQCKSVDKTASTTFIRFLMNAQ